MQIILMEKIASLGQLGDVINVKNGYARNFLIPQGKAKRATEASITEFEAKRSELEKVAAEKLADTQSYADKLDGLMVQISQKTGVDGKLFGSVTNIDIVKAIKAQGFEIDRTMIRMPDGPLKQVGDHPINIVLHSDISVNITVSVLGETTI
tara:strand:- start:3132 stop:3587 length:456 start_codon:yes stop_codon:yes gene_type:complete